MNAHALLSRLSRTTSAISRIRGHVNGRVEFLRKNTHNISLASLARVEDDLASRRVEIYRLIVCYEERNQLVSRALNRYPRL